MSPPASRTAFEHMAVVQEPVQHGRDGGAVAEQLTPVINGPVRRDERTDPLIAAHDDLQQFLRGGERQLPHAEVIASCWLPTAIRTPILR